VRRIEGWLKNAEMIVLIVVALLLALGWIVAN
jgi:hypothetical protein